MSRHYHNEIDTYACAWTRNLMSAGEIPEGTVDERPIQEVKASDLDGYAQCHFFSGIGGWPLALRLAGVDPGRSLWTASCPCQPFSTAGRGQAEEDVRHLWPFLAALVRERRPDCILGEQVASRAGREWLDGVRADLEACGYAFGAADLPACCQGAPHVRQRLFWGAVRLADTGRAGLRQLRQPLAGEARGDQGTEDQRQRVRPDAGDGGDSGRLADADGDGRRGEGLHLPQRRPREAVPDAGGASEPDGVGDAPGVGRTYCRLAGSDQRAGGSAEPRSASSAWSDFVVIPCTDGKSRRVSAQPGDEPLAARLPSLVGFAGTESERVALVAAKANRVGRLRGYGNAISPPVAAVFVRAFLAALEGS